MITVTLSQQKDNVWTKKIHFAYGILAAPLRKLRGGIKDARRWNTNPRTWHSRSSLHLVHTPQESRLCCSWAHSRCQLHLAPEDPKTLTSSADQRRT